MALMLVYAAWIAGALFASSASIDTRWAYDAAVPDDAGTPSSLKYLVCSA